MLLLLSLLSVLVLSLVPDVSASIYGTPRHHRLVYTLYSTDHPSCQHADETPLSVDGSLKLTTAASGGSGYRLCSTPVVPFGELIRDPRGIRFWYLRIRVTKLSPGQELVVVSMEKQDMSPGIVDNDKHHRVTSEAKTIPTEFQLRYRYARLFWVESSPPGPPVNITVSRYARFDEQFNYTSRRLFCERYGNVWCQKKVKDDGGSDDGGLCVAPGSCSLRADCFDLFEEPNKCPDGPFWLGGVGSSNRSNLLHPTHSSWLSRNFPWLAFGAVPIALAFALAKICAQKRELDIDDDYDYKLSCSERGGRRSDEEEGDGDEAGSDSFTFGGGPRQSALARSPSANPTPDPEPAISRHAHHSGSLNRDSQIRGKHQTKAPPPPPPPQPSAKSSPPQLDFKASVANDEEPAPPPPPPRRWDRASLQLRAPQDYEGSFEGNSRPLLCQVDAPATGFDGGAERESVELTAIAQQPAGCA